MDEDDVQIKELFLRLVGVNETVDLVQQGGNILESAPSMPKSSDYADEDAERHGDNDEPLKTASVPREGQANVIENLEKQIEELRAQKEAAKDPGERGNQES